MKNITRHTGTIDNITRIDTSYNGNPRFSFSIDGYTVQTQVDSMHGYCIENYDGKKATVTIGTHYGKTTLSTIKGK